LVAWQSPLYIITRFELTVINILTLRACYIIRIVVSSPFRRDCQRTVAPVGPVIVREAFMAIPDFSVTAGIVT